MTGRRPILVLGLGAIACVPVACTLDLPSHEAFSRGLDGGAAGSSSSSSSGGAIDASDLADRGVPDGGAGPDAVAPGAAELCGGNRIEGDKNTLFRGDSGVVVEVCARGCEWTNDAKDRCRANAQCIAGAGLYCGGNGISGAPDVLFRCGNGKIAAEQRCPAGCDAKPANIDDACN